LFSFALMWVADCNIVRMVCPLFGELALCGGCVACSRLHSEVFFKVPLFIYIDQLSGLTAWRVLAASGRYVSGPV